MLKAFWKLRCVVSAVVAITVMVVLGFVWKMSRMFEEALQLTNPPSNTIPILLIVIGAVSAGIFFYLSSGLESLESNSKDPIGKDRET